MSETDREAGKSDLERRMREKDNAGFRSHPPDSKPDADGILRGKPPDHLLVGDGVHGASKTSREAQPKRPNAHAGAGGDRLGGYLKRESLGGRPRGR
jgi:hypothetical protein